LASVRRDAARALRTPGRLLIVYPPAHVLAARDRQDEGGVIIAARATRCSLSTHNVRSCRSTQIRSSHPIPRRSLSRAAPDAAARRPAARLRASARACSASGSQWRHGRWAGAPNYLIELADRALIELKRLINPQCSFPRYCRAERAHQVRRWICALARGAKQHGFLVPQIQARLPFDLLTSNTVAVAPGHRERWREAITR